MILVGIDVAKDKHDCCITNTDGEMLFDIFTITNNSESFDILYERIRSVAPDLSKVKVGLEATGHYIYNILSYLLDKHLTAYVINPLHTNFYRKGLSLRKTKTDRIDSRTIALMLLTDLSLKPYSVSSYHRENLKSLTRYRFSRVQERSRQKSSISRLVTILFPELSQLVPCIHISSIYTMLEELPGASYVASVHLTRLTNILSKASKGRFGREMAITFREAARTSIGAKIPAKSLELRHTIADVRAIESEIREVETEIQKLMDEETTTITSVPGIGTQMGAIILAEIGDFSRFDSPDKILAFAGMSPSTYQSGKMISSYAHMEKRGSRYLRFALFNVTKHVCNYDPGFAAYLAKKRAEGKHYNVAISHAAKRLVRMLYAMETNGTLYEAA